MGGRVGFFKPGGTLPPGSASYVSRRADAEIANSLLSGEYVFILDSRQKGKSSLIVRSLERLHLESVTTLRIDLQRLGTNLQPEQWYAGLLHAIGQELGLTSPLFAYWKDHAAVGPVYRFFGAIESVVLALRSGPIVFFIDEVDFVQALPFATDEFFAAIRECYNRRSSNPVFQRLTFCLVGVAAPSQLIQNQDVTPFNVGHRIELNDFSIEETQIYADEFTRLGRDGPRILARIHDWVNGHPYLTQLLASEVAADDKVQTPADVDALVRRQLLSAEARQREPNIADSERRMLESNFPGESKDESRSRILEAHRLLLSGRLVSANHQEQLISTILLSGIAVEEAGSLRIRNRLYRELFDERWRRNSLPDSEAQRQRAASARAAWKVTWISLAIFTVFCVVLTWLISLTRDRDRALAESRRLAQANTLIAYESSMALGAQRLQEGSNLEARELIESQQSSPERSWEWGFLNATVGQPRIVRNPSSANRAKGLLMGYWREDGNSIEISDSEILINGKLVASGPNGRAMFPLMAWLRGTRGQGPIAKRVAQAHPLFLSPANVDVVFTSDLRTSVKIAPGGKSIVITDRSTGSRYEMATPFAASNLQFIRGNLIGVEAELHSAITYDVSHKRWIQTSGIFSPDGTQIVSTPLTPPSVVRKTSDGSIISRFTGHMAPDISAEWFRDGTRVVTFSHDGMVRMWSVSSGRLLRAFTANRTGFMMVSLSSDEHTITGCMLDGSILEWQVDEPDIPQTIHFSQLPVLSIRISPDGNRCFTTSKDGLANLLDVGSAKILATYLLGTVERAPSNVFSSDGAILAVVDAGGAVLFIDSHTGAIKRKLSVPSKHAISVAFSHDGKVAISFQEANILTLRDWKDSSLMWNSPGFVCIRIKYSRGGESIAVCSKTGQIALLDSQGMRVARLLKSDSDRVTDIEFSGDGKWLSASTYLHRAFLFALDGSNRQLVLSGHASRVWQARFSPDSRKLLTTSFDGTARVWNVEDGRQDAILQHGSWVSAAEWSPDGRRVLTTCSDHYVRIFDPRNGFEIVKFSGHGDSILDGNFTPDGKTLITANLDGTIQVWRSLWPKSMAEGTASRTVDSMAP